MSTTVEASSVQQTLNIIVVWFFVRHFQHILYKVILLFAVYKNRLAMKRVIDHWHRYCVNAWAAPSILCEHLG